MGSVRGALAVPVAWLAGLADRHPFRVAGLVAALAGTTAAAVSVGERGASAVTLGGLVAFAATRPAYAVAVAAGLVVLVRPGS